MDCSDYHIKLSNAVNKLRPRPHVYVFMRKWRLFCSFSPSVHTQTLIQKTGLKVETFENGDFRKRCVVVWTGENGDLKTVLI